MSGESVPIPQRLSEETIQRELRDLSGWHLHDGVLHCALTFRDFAEAFSFMTAAALVSEQLGHHPEWCNTYNRVSIRLFTHDAGGVTDRDIEWVRRVSPFQPSSIAHSPK